MTSQSVLNALNELKANIGALQQGAKQLDLDWADLQAAIAAEDVPVPPDLVVLPPKSKGIDVSKWQGVIDWQKVKSAGIVFAFIKASEGTTYVDPMFAQNWRLAKAAGVARGAYHFYRFAFDPVAQANHFAALLNSDPGELLPVVDVEDAVSPVDLTKTVKIFCEQVYRRMGRRCLIYTGAWWWSLPRIGSAQPWVKDYPLWIAAYVSGVPRIPPDWLAWAFWQYSNKGVVSGISGDVDMDVSA